MADWQAFTQSLMEQPDPPCVAFRCAMRDTCSAQQLACEAFALYVTRGRCWDPHSEIGVGGRGKKVLVGMRRRIEASSEIYARVYTREDAPWTRGQERLVVAGTTEDTA